MKYIIVLLLAATLLGIGFVKTRKSVQKVEKEIELGNKIVDSIPKINDIIPNIKDKIEEKFEFDSYEEGMEYSRQNSKPVFLFFEANYCALCQKMKQDVLSKQNVKDALKKYVTIYVDVEKDQKSLVKYNITQLPTFMFLNKQHQLQERFVGLRSEKDFLDIVSKIK